MKCYAALFLILSASLPMVAQQKRGWSDSARVNASGPATLETPETILRALIRSGRIEELRWPDFSDYRADVEKLYSRLGYAPAWLRDEKPTPQAFQMIYILQQADTEGLHAEDYDYSRWTERLVRLQTRHSPSDQVLFDAALTVCALRYVSDLRVGRINPRYLKFGVDVGPKELDLPAFVRQRLADGKDLKSELADIEPPFVGYRDLRNALVTYLRLAKEDDGEKLPVLTDMGYPGPPYPGYIRLTRLLRLLGDLPNDYSVTAASLLPYDPSLGQAVRHFQQRHGLAITGYLDVETVEQLNVPLSYRIEQIRLALERYRWLRYDFPQPPIVMNIPGFHLYAFNEEGKIALNMRVDAGDDFENTRTPVMEEYIQYIVFRPYWDVPLGIQKNEIVPAIIEDPDYLSKYRYEVISPAGQAVSNGKVTPKMLQDLRTGRVHVRQRPGPENALGLVKFIFPNRYSVYLHDIPARDFYFALPAKRVVSHGCVHVEKPAELAAWVLRDQPQWTLERVKQAMQNGQDNLRVTLSKPLPVLFVYTTVTAGENGDISFYNDVYGYDADHLKALARGYPYRKETEVSGKR